MHAEARAPEMPVPGKRFPQTRQPPRQRGQFPLARGVAQLRQTPHRRGQFGYGFGRAPDVSSPGSSNP